MQPDAARCKAQCVGGSYFGFIIYLIVETMDIKKKSQHLSKKKHKRGSKSEQQVLILSKCQKEHEPGFEPGSVTVDGSVTTAPLS